MNTYPPSRRAPCKTKKINSNLESTRVLYSGPKLRQLGVLLIIWVNPGHHLGQWTSRCRVQPCTHACAHNYAQRRPSIQLYDVQIYRNMHNCIWLKCQFVMLSVRVYRYWDHGWRYTEICSLLAMVGEHSMLEQSIWHLLHSLSSLEVRPCSLKATQERELWICQLENGALLLVSCIFWCMQFFTLSNVCWLCICRCCVFVLLFVFVFVCVCVGGGGLLHMPPLLSFVPRFHYWNLSYGVILGLDYEYNYGEWSWYTGVLILAWAGGLVKSAEEGSKRV